MGIRRRRAAIATLFGGDPVFSALWTLLSPSGLAMWPVQDKVGSTVARVYNTALPAASIIPHDPDMIGTHVSVTLGQATGKPFKLSGVYGGDPARTGIGSTKLGNFFNGAAGSAGICFKAPNAAWWTEGVLRYLYTMHVASTNRFYFIKNTGNNQLDVVYVAGGTSSAVSIPTTSTAWMSIILTWNKAQNRARAYLNGLQVGSDVTGLGTFAGTLNASICNLGAQTAGTAHLTGSLAYAWLTRDEITPATALSVATALGVAA